MQKDRVAKERLCAGWLKCTLTNIGKSQSCAQLAASYIVCLLTNSTAFVSKPYRIWLKREFANDHNRLVSIFINAKSTIRNYENGF